jgi:FAD:protein FMN transferase
MVHRIVLLAALAAPVACLAVSPAPGAEAPATSQPVTQGNPNWPEGYALHVKLTVAESPDPVHIRWPSVVVWIFDQNRKPVRTLALWADRPESWRYMHFWWTLTGSKLKYAALNKISEAPHKPGEYELVWDGKDDSGKFVKAGIYSVTVEAYVERTGDDALALMLKCADGENHIEINGKGGVSKASAEFKRTQP